MAIWQVDIVGPPRIRLGDRSVPLPTRQTRALLASLLLEPEVERRERLAHRFWPAGRDPLKSLRASLGYLREAFGAAHIEADHAAIRLDRSQFVTDYGLIRDHCERARTAPNAAARRPLLMTAAEALRGEFLEGGNDFPDGDGFLYRWRARCDRLATRVLIALADAQAEEDDPAGAYETLEGALLRTPEDASLAERFRYTARKIGRDREAELRLEELGAARSSSPTVSQTRTVIAEKDTVDSPPLRELLGTLALFSAPFPATLARRVTRAASPSALEALVAAGELRTVTVGAARERWFLIPSDERRSLRSTPMPMPMRRQRPAERSFVFALYRLLDRTTPDRGHTSTAPNHPIVGDLNAYGPHFAAAVSLLIRRRRHASAAPLAFLTALARHRMFSALEGAREWVERAANDETLATGTRVAVAWLAEEIARERRDFRAAARWFHAVALSCPSGAAPEAEPDLLGRVTRLTALATAYHHAGDYARALTAARDARALIVATAERKPSDPEAERVALFCIAEVAFSHDAPGAVTEALDAIVRCRALDEHQTDPERRASSAYLHGLALHAAGRSDDALRVFDEALTRYQDIGHAHGIADCLRSLAFVRCVAGALGEARALAAQALTLYEKLGIFGSVAATRGLLGDIARARGDHEAARGWYTQSLAYWQSVDHPRWIAHNQDRLRSLVIEARGQD